MLSRFVGSSKSRLFSGRFCVMFRGVRYYFLGGFWCVSVLHSSCYLWMCAETFLTYYYADLRCIDFAYKCALLTFGANNKKIF